MPIRLSRSAVVVVAALCLCRPAHSAAFTDGEVAKILDVANQGEIDAARLAHKRAHSPDVKRFAQRMEKEHSETKGKLNGVVSKEKLDLADTDASRDTAKRDADDRERLKPLSGADFDRAYMESQVSGHTQLLQKLDGDLIPNAKNASFNALLRKVRAMVARHLAEARRLQSKLTRPGRE